MIEYPKAQILVVDDIEPMRRIYCNLFDQIGLDQPDTVSTTDAAFEMICSRDYALIISDWHMAGSTGLQFLTRVRMRPASSTIPFIMATAENRPESLRAAYGAGATDYLMKPFSLATFKTALEKALPPLAAAIAPIVAPTMRSVEAPISNTWLRRQRA